MSEVAPDVTVEETGQEQGQNEAVEKVDVQKEVEQASLSEEQIKEVQKKAYGYAFGQIDTKLKELGYEKPEGVKTSEFLVELLTKKEEKGTKEQPQKVDDTELSAKFKALQSKYEEKEAEIESIKASVMTQKRDYWVDSLVNSAQIDIPDHLSEQEKVRMAERTKNLIKSELTAKYDLKEGEDGKFKFFNKDGSPLLDTSSVEMNPMSPEQLLQSEFSEFLRKAPQKKEPVKGTGVTKDDLSKETVQKVVPSKIKTASDFYAYLREEKGLIMGSKEFVEQINLAKKERPAMF